MKNLLLKKNNKNKSIIALIDGEHYPQVTYDAVNILKKNFPGKFKGIVFLGGTEKLIVGNLKEYFSAHSNRIDLHNNRCGLNNKDSAHDDQQ